MIVLSTQNHVEAATAHITERLREAIDARGRAVLLVSGGSSPRPVFAALSETELDWGRVKVGLVDERVEEAGSNAQFVRDTLLQGRAAGATFVCMKSDGAAYADLVPADVCVMGMGTDGHTASWFPGTPDLARATDPGSEAIVIAADTGDSPGNSGFQHRLTLTLPAVLQSRSLLLYIPGAAKREVFSNREGLPVDLLTQSERLTVITEPDPVGSNHA